MTALTTGALKPWQETVNRKRLQREEKLAPYVQHTVDELLARPTIVENIAEKSKIGFEAADEVTDINAIEDLLGRLVTGSVSAEDVTLSYIKRATVAHQLTNALTEIMFDEALEQARKLDDQFKQTKKLCGPLHGIPIMLKDQFNVKGFDTTLGYTGRAFKPAEEDAVLVQILKGMGAILLGKTNLPQSIMWCETDNPMWGLTVNPRNPDLTPGGSTGGESALQALHGSLVGFGTDIGGSVRIPQNMMGGYGFKPSSARLPYEGVPVSTEGQEHVPSSIGPMTRSLSSMTYIMKALIEGKPWTLDPRCLPLPWRQNEYSAMRSRKLVIGVIVDDGVVTVHPPIRRALDDMVLCLENAGHEIVPWDNSGHAECISIMDQYYTADGCEDIRNDVGAGGEPFIPHVAALVNRGKAISVYQYWQLNKQKFAAQKKYLDKWNAARSPSGKPVDILLTPTMPHTSVKHRTCRWVGYTKVWNFLDYTALSFPVSKVSRELDPPTFDEVELRNEQLDGWNKSLYDLDLMAEHPISLQIVGRKLEEEKVLGAAAAVEEAWREHGVSRQYLGNENRSR